MVRWLPVGPSVRCVLDSRRACGARSVWPASPSADSWLDWGSGHRPRATAPGGFPGAAVATVGAFRRLVSAAACFRSSGACRAPAPASWPWRASLPRPPARAAWSGRWRSAGQRRVRRPVAGADPAAVPVEAPARDMVRDPDPPVAAVQLQQALRGGGLRVQAGHPAGGPGAAEAAGVPGPDPVGGAAAGVRCRARRLWMGAASKPPAAAP